MSRIFTEWKCKKCKHKFQRYVSFGHPTRSFVYEWECEKCGHVNTLKVKAWPRFWL